MNIKYSQKKIEILNILLEQKYINYLQYEDLYGVTTKYKKENIRRFNHLMLQVITTIKALQLNCEIIIDENEYYLITYSNQITMNLDQSKTLLRKYSFEIVYILLLTSQQVTTQKLKYIFKDISTESIYHIRKTIAEVIDEEIIYNKKTQSYQLKSFEI